MPLKTPFSSSSKKSKSRAKPKGKSSSRAKGTSKAKAAPQKKGKAAPASHAPEPVSLNFWDSLTDERKLDVVGAVMSMVGVAILLLLFSNQLSPPIDFFMSGLTRTFGWGISVLAFGLIAMGVWLILRRIEKLPPLTLERATGIIILFLWLLATMHSIIAAPARAEEAALNGDGGGVIGSFFEKVLFNNLGMWGAVVALSAWLLIALAMTFDIEIQDMFKWVNPLYMRLRERFLRRISQAEFMSPEDEAVASDGYTPLHRPEPVVNETPLGTPVTTVRSAEAVIEWQLPNVEDILDSGSAPEVNEEFIQQRARLIQETLASFGAPVQVVEINRGPAITQFGVEPLFV
ncbi:MAG TPA: DNA translocase FtsK 4TM domain-containing protein, partial [Anaerolineales bacterium]|nr:DNA translocase FtsK 4TM domain-containing protein [Anaerolineales bacterium]